jgi:hypothetical protein
MNATYWTREEREAERKKLALCKTPSTCVMGITHRELEKYIATVDALEKDKARLIAALRKQVRLDHAGEGSKDCDNCKTARALLAKIGGKL